MNDTETFMLCAAFSWSLILILDWVFGSPVTKDDITALRKRVEELEQR